MDGVEVLNLICVCLRTLAFRLIYYLRSVFVEAVCGFGDCRVSWAGRLARADCRRQMGGFSEWSCFFDDNDTAGTGNWLSGSVCESGEGHWEVAGGCGAVVEQ